MAKIHYTAIKLFDKAPPLWSEPYYIWTLEKKTTKIITSRNQYLDISAQTSNAVLLPL